LLKAFFDSPPETGDRPIHLAYMHLRLHGGANMLSDCEEYFRNHSRLVSCFKDLQPFLELFEPEDERKFMASCAAQNLQQDLQQTTINLMKSRYFLRVSKKSNPAQEEIEKQFALSTELLVLSKDVDIGCPYNPRHKCRDVSANFAYSC
jgi:hypothetical protein